MNTRTETYLAKQKKHEQEVKQIKNTSLRISILRLITVIGFGLSLYYYFKLNNEVLLVLAGICTIAFFTLIKIHGRLSFKRKIKDALVAINKDEIDYLENKNLNYNNGSEYIDTTHSYSYDLDIFGDKSLFQILNRTATYIGKTKLANSLLSIIPNTEIILNQQAISELSKDIEWRQGILAYSKTTEDSKEIYTELIRWSKAKEQKTPIVLTIISFLFPAIYFVALGGMIFTDNGIFNNIALFTFLINLFILMSQYNNIKAEMLNATKIKDILRNYSLIIKQIENKDLTSEKLNQLKNKLNDNEGLASEQIKKLSSLFGQLENILNPIGAGLFNGVILYHLHTLRSLYKWKSAHRTKITAWLDVIGEIEKLNSFANFAYNNTDFTYPELNSNYKIEFNDLSHPLLDRETRINNTVDFNNQNFIILTGSNMSGKSTFLRSLGINMVLAGTGSPICASKANIHPLNVLVSMRLSDSLSDNESYFFAEVKRLKEIMDKADKTISFVLLDEILRGTNSDDKRTGTVEVIKKIIGKKVVGAIATHDLKVCDTTQEYPETLTNKCFEVEIINNELVFDYKLRDGVCKNKSATFLMKKMQVI
ncbi:MAG: DNA mismatch repair protein [Flavobacteriales bacterium]|nr:MAG: DNA mismatch repair protein [Flavobacteriales bacterium]